MASQAADRVGVLVVAVVVVVVVAEHHATGYHSVDMQQPNLIQPYRS